MEEITLRHLITERLAKEPINFLTEYGKIHRMFYKGGLYHYHCQHFVVGVFDQFSLNFHEFNDKYGFKFELKPNMDMSVDKLIDLCEYVFNMCNKIYSDSFIIEDLSVSPYDITAYIQKLIGVLNYKIVMDNEYNWHIIVPDDFRLTTVEKYKFSKDSTYYKLAKYRHPDACGNIELKRSLLESFAYEIEAKKHVLQRFNEKFKSELFMLFNDANIRHNNENEDAKDYSQNLMSCTRQETEEIFDTVYEMCLLAFTILIHVDNKENVEKCMEICKPTKKNK